MLSTAFCFCPFLWAEVNSTVAQPNAVIKAKSAQACNSFTFDATDSYDPQHQDISFLWDFGDGTTSTQSVAEHTYQKIGTYKVQLTVKDTSNSNCGVATKTQLVTANLPPEAVIKSPDKVCFNQSVDLDGSQSHNPANGPLSYHWELGDGSAQEGAKVIKLYNHPGTYNAALTVDDNAGTSCSQSTAQKKIRVNEAPVADAGGNINAECLASADSLSITFDGSKSYDSTNDPLTYSWNFGDGTTAQGEKVTHHFSEGGKYNVTLTVTDDSGLKCNASTDTIEVTLSQAPKADAGKDISVCVGEVVNFDGTNSFVDKREALFSLWTFGDGANERGLKVQHYYNKPGVYKAVLSVENAHSLNCPKSTDSRMVYVSAAPKITLNASEKVGCVGKEILFDVTSNAVNKKDLTYFWSFGDGTILKAGPRVTHPYKKGGTYKVTVILDMEGASPCATQFAMMNLKINTPPKADAGPNLVCCANEQADFDGSKSADADGDPLTYQWDFGDGEMATGAKAVHQYLKGGSYQVKLTVDDNSGSSCSEDEAAFTAEVNEKPVPVIKVR